MFKKELFFLIGLGIGFWGLPAVESQIGSLDDFQRIIILENGRLKPLDTFARNTLKQLSGRSSISGRSASSWLAMLFFTPGEVSADPVFLVNDPEVLAALGLPAEGRKRCSYSELMPVGDKLEKLAIAASALDEKVRSTVENGLIRLYTNLVLFHRLAGSMGFAFTAEELSIPEAEVRRFLDLPEQQNHFSYYELAQKGNPIRQVVSALQTKPQNDWTVIETRLFQLAAAMQQMTQSYRESPLKIIPPAAGKEEAWLSGWELVAGLNTQPQAMKEELEMLNRTAQAFAQNRELEFTVHLQAFNQSVQSRLPAGEPVKKIGLEISYNRFDPFFKSQILYGLALLLLLLSLLVLQKWFYRLSLGLLVLGLLPHTYGLIARMIITGRPPVTNLFETFIFVAWIGVLLGAIVEFLQKKALGIVAGGFVGLAFLLISNRYAMEGDTMGVLVAVLNTNLWLTVHVITITMGYAGCVVAGIIGHIYLIQRLIRPEAQERLIQTFRSLYGTLAFGLVFTFLGTIMGGIWADQSWGRFWGWDPKENGALLIILWSVILFHAKLAGLVRELGMAAGSIGGIIAVVSAWFGVNLLGVGMHSYGFTSGLARTLLVFVILEVVFVTGTVLLIKKKARA